MEEPPTYRRAESVMSTGMIDSSKLTCKPDQYYDMNQVTG